MPRYRVLETSFIHDRIVEPDDEIDYAGEPGSNLLPLDSAAKKAKAAAERKPEPELEGDEATAI